MFYQREFSVFKYGKFKDLERTLSACTVGFSKLSDFNDPFEASYEYVHHFDSETSRNSLYNESYDRGEEWGKVKAVRTL